jgi:hypothetical protein
MDVTERLAELRELGLYRRTRMVSGPQGPRVVLDGKPVLLLCSNNYLGLADHPRVREAAADAAMRWGVGAGASRLVSGTMTVHRRLEERLAAFEGSEAALLFGSGYLANVGVVGALARLPFLAPASARALVENVVHGFVIARRPRQAVVASIWTIASWVLVGLSFWLLMKAFHLGLSPLAGIVTAIATGLAFVIPAAPASVGVFEAAGLAVTDAYGISRSHALAYVVTLHALNFLPFFAAGLVILAGQRRLGSRAHAATADETAL